MFAFTLEPEEVVCDPKGFTGFDGFTQQTIGGFTAYSETGDCSILSDTAGDAIGDLKQTLHREFCTLCRFGQV